MTDTPTRLHWLKFNPSEWQGRCSSLEDAEYGFYHRIVEVLWSTPGNRIAKPALIARMRLHRDPERMAMLDQLIHGQELREDEDGMIDCPSLHEAFEDACRRAAIASKGGQAKAQKARAKREHDEIDF